jgi:natural product precursor
MKKLAKLKLNVLNEHDLIEKQMNSLKGGTGACYCSCYWENNTGSSTADNKSANAGYGYSSQHGVSFY